MAAYTDEQRERLLGTPIEDVLRALGRDTRHGRDNMYRSPFRDECEPSFHVSPDRNRWYDFGLGEGGSVLTLVCRLLGCNGGKGYDFLAELSGDAAVAAVTSPSPRRPVRDRAITVLGLSGFDDADLVRYAASRRISPATLERFCRQVTFAYREHPHTARRAIGLLNDSGGWILRAEGVKRSTSGDITTIRGCGRPSPGEPDGIVFEGMFDFLSYAQMHGGEPDADVCVLNSVAHVRKAQSWLGAHTRLDAYLDNDEAGRRALQEIGGLLPPQGVILDDWSGRYGAAKDLNEVLVSMVPEGETSTIQYQSLWNSRFQRKFRKD